MTSAHHHHAKYSLHPPPQSSQNDFLRLPSLKDLNFQYSPQNGGRGPQFEPAPQQQEHPAIPRHVSGWSRTQNTSSTSLPSSHPHQQHTPPLSAGAHDLSSTKVEYLPKHENGGYVHPGVPLSAQVTPIPASVNVNSVRNDEPPHSPNQPKRTRAIPTNMGASRDVRQSHSQPTPSYPTQYAPFPPTQQQQPPPPQQQQQQQQQQPTQYHQIPSGMPAPPTNHTQPTHTQPALPPSTHEQMHQQPIPVSSHSAYQSYQQYMRPVAQVMHQQHQSNPYPSPGPPPSAPPPQGPWAQQAHAPPPAAPQHAPHQPPPQQQPQHIHPSHLQNHHQVQPPPQHATVPSNPPQSAYMVPQHHMQQQQQQQQQPQQQPQSHLQQPPQQQQQQQQPQPSQPQPQQQPPLSSQSAPAQQQQQQQVPPQQHPHQYQQPSQIPFTRTTAIIPTNINARPTYAPSDFERTPTTRNDTIAQINQHCSVLYNFASRYAQMQSTMPHVQPSPQELEEMSHRAQAVVRLLDELQRMNMPEGEPSTDMNAPAAAPASMQMSPDDPRPPKRPWEDISQDDNTGRHLLRSQQQQTPQQYPASTENKPQTTAEQDMELIRTKRATSTAGTNGPAGQPKSKYRKRSRATPPGKCHSCNIRETPEWRRGPDGARTLCNACGLHYAKLMRKRDKNANGEAPQIDLETLRASARAADIADKASRSKPSSSARTYMQSEPASPMDTKQQVPQHHQGSFQIIAPPLPPPSQEQSNSMVVNSNNDSNASRNAAPPPPHHAHQSNLELPTGAPPPPWVTSSTSRTYTAPGHLQPQSFMRSSQQHGQSR